MSQPLSPEQKRSVEDALGLLERLLHCAGQLPATPLRDDYRNVLQQELDALNGMLANGTIDVDSNSSFIPAETDRDGIHLNDTQSIFSMPGDLMLEDCREGYFASAWLLIGILIHERYHYQWSTGIVGSLGKVVSFVFGGTALLWSSVVEGKTFRSLKWHEFKAYAWANLQLMKALSLLEDVCRQLPGCIPCCPEHAQWLGDAAARQDAWSKYGQ